MRHLYTECVTIEIWSQLFNPAPPPPAPRHCYIRPVFLIRKSVTVGTERAMLFVIRPFGVASTVEENYATLNGAL
jgi:hypothetical protein